MLRDEVAIGAIAVMRLEPQLFPKAQVELLKTFAGQAVIAIENTRLLAELQERTRQLSQSLEDLRAAQDGLIQTEKLAALGRLVAGVAHEINTPVGTSLTVASAFIDKTKRFEADVASGNVRRSTLSEFIAASREAASQIMANLGHAVDLIQSFKQVATDRSISDRKPFDLGQVTEQVVKGVRFGLPNQNFTVSIECEPNLAMNSYPGPYGQVLTNLILNSATHAFPDGARGNVRIAAQGAGKDSVEVLFSDDGCGMSPEVRRQVFDPFFTTRRDQGSTGLGLHIVHNIVTNRLGGRINLDTRPGAGTKIRIIVPREAPLEFAAE
jgi:signal transduction histidine kinase